MRSGCPDDMTNSNFPTAKFKSGRGSAFQFDMITRIPATTAIVATAVFLLISSVTNFAIAEPDDEVGCSELMAAAPSEFCQRTSKGFSQPLRVLLATTTGAYFLDDIPSEDTALYLQSRLRQVVEVENRWRTQEGFL